MKAEKILTDVDRDLLARAVDGFVPQRVIDIHGHLFHPHFCEPEALTPILADGQNVSDYRAALELLLPDRTLEAALFFPFPFRLGDREGLNKWMFEEVQSQNTLAGFSLALAAPEDGPEIFDRWMGEGKCMGLKPYHYYSGCSDTLQAELEQFVPEWMWKVCDRHNGTLMIHLVRDGAVSDPGNLEALSRLCDKYPSCRVILPHIARAFNFRTAHGLAKLADKPNIFVDTSAITESEGMRIALETLGPKRVFFGTDYPISHLRGHCATAGDTFHWFYADEIKNPRLALTGIESLLCLREAIEQVGLSSADIERIYAGNAREFLAMPK